MTLSDNNLIYSLRITALQYLKTMLMWVNAVFPRGVQMYDKFIFIIINTITG